MLRLQCRVSCIPYHFRENTWGRVREGEGRGGSEGEGTEPKGAGLADVLQGCIIENDLPDGL